MQHEPEAGVPLARHSFAADGGWLTGPERPDDFCFLMILAGQHSVGSIARFKGGSLSGNFISFFCLLQLYGPPFLQSLASNQGENQAEVFDGL